MDIIAILQNGDLKTDLFDYTEKPPCYDVVIKTNENDLYFYKTLLVMYSNYYKAMFTCGMKESTEGVVNVEFSKDCLNVVFNFIYFVASGDFESLNLVVEKIKENTMLMFEVVDFANQCQIEKLLKLLDGFLCRNVNDFIYTTAINVLFRYKLPGFTHAAVCSICSKPEILANCEDIGELDKYVLKKFECNERALYILAHAWLVNNKENKEYIADLLTENVISKSTIKTDDILNELAEYCPDDLKIKILQKVSSNYMKFRQIVDTMIPQSEISSIEVQKDDIRKRKNKIISPSLGIIDANFK